MNVTTVGIDLAKNVFSVHGVDAHGKPVLKKTISRGKLLECFANLPPCLIGKVSVPATEGSALTVGLGIGGFHTFFTKNRSHQPSHECHACTNYCKKFQ